jgi:ribosomal protein L11 methyltransferase
MADDTGSALVRLDVLVPEPLHAHVLGLFTEHVSCGWEEEDLADGRTIFRLYTDNAPLLARMRDALRDLPGDAISQTEITRLDWTSAWREYFTPIAAGRFLIVPPWLADERTQRQKIIIDPKSAFGTGHHASTVLCLEGLSRLLDAGLPARPRVLDLGTGTGILGIACATQGLCAVGVDIDPVATDNARENIILNQAADRMRAITGGVEAVRGERFDLVLANILAEPLREMAPELVRLLVPDGRLILSGILTRQADAVAGAYATLGMPAHYSQGEWISLVW